MADKQMVQLRPKLERNLIYHRARFFIISRHTRDELQIIMISIEQQKRNYED